MATMITRTPKHMRKQVCHLQTCLVHGRKNINYNNKLSCYDERRKLMFSHRRWQRRSQGKSTLAQLTMRPTWPPTFKASRAVPTYRETPLALLHTAQGIAPGHQNSGTATPRNSGTPGRRATAKPRPCSNSLFLSLSPCFSLFPQPLLVFLPILPWLPSCVPP